MVVELGVNSYAVFIAIINKYTKSCFMYGLRHFTKKAVSNVLLPQHLQEQNVYHGCSRGWRGRVWDIMGLLFIF